MERRVESISSTSIQVSNRELYWRAMTSPNQAPNSTCANCDTIVTGKYCANCGQPNFPLQMPLRVFLKSAIHEIFALDSRLFRTLGPLLFKPGHVTNDYVSGHRAKYVPPFRLYIIISFILFLILAIVPSDVININNTDSDDTTEVNVDSLLATLDDIPLEGVSNLPIPAIEAESADTSELARKILAIDANKDRFMDDFFGRVAQAMFFLLPVFALVLKVLYRSRYYVEHLIFSIYFHCFVFVVVIAATFIGLIPGISGVGDALSLLIPVYLVVGIRKVYGQGWGKTIFKSAFLGFTHLMIVGVTLGGILFLTFWFS